MKLVTCPKCLRSVSDRAGACPYCGCPIERMPLEPVLRAHLRRRYRVAMLGSLLAIGLGLALSLRDLDYLAFSVLGIVGFGVARAYLKDLDR